MTVRGQVHDTPALPPGKAIPVTAEQEVGPTARSVGCDGNTLAALEGGGPSRSVIAIPAHSTSCNTEQTVR
jgi:hypothetical protein